MPGIGWEAVLRNLHAVINAPREIAHKHRRVLQRALAGAGIARASPQPHRSAFFVGACTSVWDGKIKYGSAVPEIVYNCYLYAIPADMRLCMGKNISVSRPSPQIQKSRSVLYLLQFLNGECAGLPAKSGTFRSDKQGSLERITIAEREIIWQRAVSQFVFNMSCHAPCLCFPTVLPYGPEYPSGNDARRVEVIGLRNSGVENKIRIDLRGKNKCSQLNDCGSPLNKGKQNQQPRYDGEKDGRDSGYRAAIGVRKITLAVNDSTSRSWDEMICVGCFLLAACAGVWGLTMLVRG